MSLKILTRDTGALVLSVLDGFSSVATKYRTELASHHTVQEGNLVRHQRDLNEAELELIALDAIIGKTAELRAALEGLVE